MRLYQDGVELSRACNQRLESAKKKIEVLTKNKKGEFELRPLEESGGEK